MVIADDQALVREALTLLIDSLGPYRVVRAAGETSTLLAAVEQNRPRIAVLDARMPEALHAVRHMALHAPDTRVVLLDEFPTESSMWRGTDSTFGYMTKCDSSAQVAAVLKRVAAGQRVVPAEWRQPTPPTDGAAPSVASASQASPPSVLTRRELEVLRLLAEGLTVRQCADRLSISTNTVDNHKARIMQKLGLHKTVELARFAVRYGIVSDR